MTLQSKKPIVNKETFKDNVTQWAAVLAVSDKPRVGNRAFDETDVSNMESLFERVKDLYGIFNSQDGILNKKSKDAHLAKHLHSYRLDGRRALAKNYQNYSSYYTRAFHELISIAVHVAEYFDGIMIPTAVHYESPFISKHFRGQQYTAKLDTAGEGYCHANFAREISKFLYNLRPLDTSGLEPERLLNEFEITDTVIDALSIVQSALYVMKMYSGKRWKKQTVVEDPIIEARQTRDDLRRVLNVLKSANQEQLDKTMLAMVMQVHTAALFRHGFDKKAIEKVLAAKTFKATVSALEKTIARLDTVKLTTILT